MIREPYLLYRTIEIARHDAKVGVYEPDGAVTMLVSKAPDAFDPVKNLEHRRIQSMRLNTAALDDLREDEALARREQPLRSLVGLAVGVGVCLVADAWSVAQLSRAHGFGHWASNFTGAAFAPGFIWLVSTVQDSRMRWTARLGLIVLVAAIVILRLQSVNDETGSLAGEGAMAIFFGALTVLPALFGESMLRELRARLRARAAIKETETQRRAAEKVIAVSDARIRKIRRRAEADDRLRTRLTAAYNREWKVERAKQPTP